MNFQLSRKIYLLDQSVLITVQTLRHPPLDRFFLVLTRTGTGMAWLVFTGLLNLLHHQGIHFIQNQTQFMNALFSPLLAWILGSILKKLFSRERPSVAITGFKQLIESPKCGSFPSSHAAASISFFVALIYIGHPFALPVGVWAILVSFSRLYLGVHYLSDVLGGVILGVLSAYAMALIFFAG